ncbi:polyketide cyclase [Paucibacter sp. KBW04]|uniref:SRPBCC family protein n=1 Tax=Paucibacter sp. KBW04 TaxID=2153361 RepID=UPI000F567960|nr:SRPBCC family protein [Paucibacter sp. KBW04]RQO53495.1 polyketide cyclase [Paucibacter sp. KBW04]
MPSVELSFDPRLDLLFQSEVDLSPAQIWAAWTQPEHLLHWFTPAPWTTVECEIVLQAGGIFRTVMRSPEGQEHTHSGCYLEIIENERLIWTDALGPGFRPALEPFITATIALKPLGPGRTLYTATARHRDETARQRHEEMGFTAGWSKALEQMVAHMQQIQAQAKPA